MSYATAAEALLALAVSQDGIVLNGAKDDPIRGLLFVAAEACRHLDQAQTDREAALLYAAELRSLLEVAAGLLEAQPLPVEGGAWDSYMLARQAQELLRSQPLTAGRALREELQAARAVARAAAALASAQQERDPARIRTCEQVLQQAVAKHQAVHERASTDPLPPGPMLTGDGS